MTEIGSVMVSGLLPRRKPESNKNDYGRVCLLCGSEGYTGAAYFAAQGAVCCGSGVVTLATPRAVYPILAGKLAEPVVRPLPADESGRFSADALPVLLQLSQQADAVLIGCGIGQSPALDELICTAVQQISCPLVLDADGINALARHKDSMHGRKAPLILTPHAGEFARLSGGSADAAEAARFAQEYSAVVVLKSHRTQIFTPDGRSFRNSTGNPGMAKGGSGDVLAGMLVSLCGQGLSACDAACAAVWLHGKTGDACANALSEYGMTPNDMLEMLPRFLKQYNSREW